jgi:hypothetical protein
MWLDYRIVGQADTPKNREAVCSATPCCWP